jgi:ADP-heptose:LPS heptosyltransferase
MFRSGIPVRIGSGYRYYSSLFNRRVFEHRSDAKRHEVEYNLGLLKELDCTEPGTPEFFVDIPPGAKFRVQELLSSLGVSNAKEIVVIHPGTGGSAREWSVENFGRLATALLDGQDVQIVLTGVYGDEWKVAEIRRRTHDRAFSSVGKLTLKELAALLQSAALFVSNSTGPLHLAVAVGTPVIGIYSQLTAMSPARWGPYTDKKTVFVPDRPADCSECKGKSVEQCACMERITVGDVYEAACAFLRSRKINEKHTITHG